MTSPTDAKRDIILATWKELEVHTQKKAWLTEGHPRYYRLKADVLSLPVPNDNLSPADFS